MAPSWGQGGRKYKKRIKLSTQPRSGSLFTFPAIQFGNNYYCQIGWQEKSIFVLLLMLRHLLAFKSGTKIAWQFVFNKIGESTKLDGNHYRGGGIEELYKIRMNWVCDHCSESQFKQLRKSPKKRISGLQWDSNPWPQFTSFHSLFHSFHG